MIIATPAATGLLGVWLVWLSVQGYSPPWRAFHLANSLFRWSAFISGIRQGADFARLGWRWLQMHQRADPAW